MPFGRIPDRRPASPSCLHFSRRHLPDRRSAGLTQLRPSIPAAKDKRGSQPCEGRVAGMAQVAVEQPRRQEDRSAIGSFPFPPPSPPFLC
ncbi:hypothetical protein CO667_28695 [Rhizobium sp. L43]|nr:hypothetical protein CO667_28695 [Rhizobium sp. L43]